MAVSIFGKIQYAVPLSLLPAAPTTLFAFPPVIQECRDPSEPKHSLCLHRRPCETLVPLIRWRITVKQTTFSHRGRGTVKISDSCCLSRWQLVVKKKKKNLFIDVFLQFGSCLGWTAITMFADVRPTRGTRQPPLSEDGVPSCRNLLGNTLGRILITDRCPNADGSIKTFEFIHRLGRNGRLALNYELELTFCFFGGDSLHFDLSFGTRGDGGPSVLGST